jgi:hypothetical protein
MKFRELGGRPLGGRNLPGPYISATSRTVLGGASEPPVLGPTPVMRFNAAANSQLLAVLEDF